MLHAIKQYLRERRLRRDLEKMHEFTGWFVRQCEQFSSAHGLGSEFQLLECTVLATFLVSQSFLSMSVHQTEAAEMLDLYHKQVGEILLNSNLAGMQDAFPNRDPIEHYELMMQLFYKTIDLRYSEHRLALLDETGKFKNFAPMEFSKLTQPLLKTTSTEPEKTAATLLRFQAAVISLMQLCLRAFKP